MKTPGGLQVKVMGQFHAPWGRGMQHKYLFIDGAYLREVIADFGKYWFETANVPFQYAALAYGHTKVFYYDCLPVQRSSESQEDFEFRLAAQEKFFQDLRSLHGWHVLQGILKRARKEKATQKEIDVMIAVDMLTHTYRRNMSELTFIAGDQDFLPLVEALVREGMFVTLFYERESGSRELINAADARKALDVYVLHSMLSEEFKQSHPLPALVTRPRYALKAQTLICTSEMTDEAIVEIRSDHHPSETFSAMVVRPGHSNCQCYEFNDLEFLKKVCMDCLGCQVWTDA